ncbi:hypothetical protein RJ639_042362 [Escallonia herrerae]|uniref:Uncharacterized protein n=1 Tax=Escallonia herrerae TaxID=1293975 RepID=A0AA88WIZ0_9ASTE|nr:hypothetical protein RJ639_042362 [Escallonia herrerae]
MAGREVREYTNLSDPKDKKSGKGRIDDEDITFQRMVAKMQEVAGERGGYLHGRGALDSDDLLYLKEQMEAEEDAERLLRRTEKRAFAAFKKAANLADSSPATVPLPLRVEPKPKSGIRQQVLLRKMVEVKPKRQRVSSPCDRNQPTVVLGQRASENREDEGNEKNKEYLPTRPSLAEDGTNVENPVKSSLVAYESSDNEDD